MKRSAYSRGRLRCGNPYGHGKSLFQGVPLFSGYARTRFGQQTGRCCHHGNTLNNLAGRLFGGAGVSACLAVAGLGFVPGHGAGGGCVMAAVAPQVVVAVPADVLAEDNLVAALLFAAVIGPARTARVVQQARQAGLSDGCFLPGQPGHPAETAAGIVDRGRVPEIPADTTNRDNFVFSPSDRSGFKRVLALDSSSAGGC